MTNFAGGRRSGGVKAGGRGGGGGQWSETGHHYPGTGYPPRDHAATSVVLRQDTGKHPSPSSLVICNFCMSN